MTRMDANSKEMERRLDAKRRSMVSCMSDTKWRKLFTLIHSRDVHVPHCEWFFIGDARPHPASTPIPRDLTPWGISDNVSVGGPFRYRDVHFIRWPATYVSNRFRGLPDIISEQDLVVHLRVRS